MPIDVEELNEKGTEVQSVPNRKAQDAVLGYLKKHKKQAFTQSEIAADLEMRPQQVRQCCMALTKKDLVTRKQVEVPTDKGTAQKIFWTLKQ